MIKLLFTADWHIRGSNPRNRIDDYKEALKTKLAEVISIAHEKGVNLIVTPGDIFDSFNTSIGVLLEFADFLIEINDAKIPIITTYGQHDVQGYNKESLYRTSLSLFERIVPFFQVYGSDDFYNLEDGNYSTQITFSPYSKDMDIDGYGYSPQFELSNPDFKIHVAHGTLLDHEPPFTRFTLIDDVETTADLVLTGDYHPGYGIVKRKDGKVFCNPGSLTRLSATTAALEREIKVAYIEIEGDKLLQLEEIKLKNIKPGHEVLDRQRIQEEQERQYSMENFAALIKSKTGAKVLLDINSIAEEIGKAEGVERDIINLAIEKIDKQKEVLTIGK